METKSLDIDWIETSKVLEQYRTYLETRSKERLAGTELSNNITFTLNIDRDSYEITFEAPDYWKYVNSGRRPGKQPPLSVISNWITKKRITPRLDRKIPTIQKSLAFLIARKIGKEGTKGNHFLDLTTEEAEREFESRITEAISKDISTNLDTFLRNL